VGRRRPKLGARGNSKNAHLCSHSSIHFDLFAQAKELVQTEGWGGGDLKEALIQVYLRMDEMLMRDEARSELEGLASDASPSDAGCENDLDVFLYVCVHWPWSQGKCTDEARLELEGLAGDASNSDAG